MGALAIALILGLLVYAAASSDDDGNDSASARDIVLEPAAEAGLDPFTPSVAADTPSSTIAPATRITTATAGGAGAPPTAPRFGRTPSTDAQGRPRSVTGRRGGTPGLYGGVRDRNACNKQRLVESLRANRSGAQVWSEVQGITPAEIAAFVDGLTGVILRADTRVTNHALADGRAVPRQAVLQAGTAVLVDEYGELRVRCAGGNPLLQARPVVNSPRYVGTEWPGFEPAAAIVIVKSSSVMEALTLIDVRTGALFARPTGPTAGDDRAVG